jgi:hypothetical protein
MKLSMKPMIKLSLLLNIVVLIPICFGLLSDANWIAEAYGQFSAARGILLSVYLSIGVTSTLLLFVNEPKLTDALLFVQVVYKLTTPFTVGTLFNPVVISNLAIAAFHTATLVLILRYWQKG